MAKTQEIDVAVQVRVMGSVNEKQPLIDGPQAPDTCIDDGSWEKQCFVWRDTCTCSQTNKWMRSVYEDTAINIDSKCPKCICCIPQGANRCQCPSFFCAGPRRRFGLNAVCDIDIEDPPSYQHDVSLMSSAQFVMRIHSGKDTNALCMSAYLILSFLITLSIFIERIYYYISISHANTTSDKELFATLKVALGTVLFAIKLGTFFNFVIPVCYKDCCNVSRCLKSIFCCARYCNSCCNINDRTRSLLNWFDTFNNSVIVKPIFALFLHALMYASLAISVFQFVTQYIPHKGNGTALLKSDNANMSSLIRIDFGLTVTNAILTTVTETCIRLSLVYYFQKAGRLTSNWRILVKALYYIYCVLGVAITNCLMFLAVVAGFTFDYNKAFKEDPNVQITAMSRQFWFMIAVSFVYPTISLISFLSVHYLWLREMSMGFTATVVDDLEAKSQHVRTAFNPDDVPEVIGARQLTVTRNTTINWKKFVYPFISPITATICIIYIALVCVFWGSFVVNNGYVGFENWDINNIKLDNVWLWLTVCSLIVSFVANPYPFLVGGLWIILLTVILVVLAVLLFCLTLASMGGRRR